MVRKDVSDGEANWEAHGKSSTGEDAEADVNTDGLRGWGGSQSKGLVLTRWPRHSGMVSLLRARASGLVSIVRLGITAGADRRVG
jgi:hypothetical protein